MHLHVFVPNHEAICRAFELFFYTYSRCPTPYLERCPKSMFREILFVFWAVVEALGHYQVGLPCHPLTPRQMPLQAPHQIPRLVFENQSNSIPVSLRNLRFKILTESEFF